MSMQIRIFLVIFIGGFIGGISRLAFMDNVFFNNQLLSLTIVNILGTFVLTILSELNLNQTWQLFLKVGFLGAFTSFGSLMVLLINAAWVDKVFYLVIGIVGSYLAVLLVQSSMEKKNA